MMSQFQRQLNATVVFITILSNIIAFLLVYLFISVFHINPWGPIYGPETAEVFGPAFISFFGDTALILADILCMIGFAKKPPQGVSSIFHCLYSFRYPGIFIIYNQRYTG
jgi:hypothetical protein